MGKFDPFEILPMGKVKKRTFLTPPKKGKKLQQPAAMSSVNPAALALALTPPASRANLVPTAVSYAGLPALIEISSSGTDTPAQTPRRLGPPPSAAGSGSGSAASSGKKGSSPPAALTSGFESPATPPTAKGAAAGPSPLETPRTVVGAVADPEAEPQTPCAGADRERPPSKKQHGFKHRLKQFFRIQS
eukprot:tig00021603_g22809.t1